MIFIGLVPFGFASGGSGVRQGLITSGLNHAMHAFGVGTDDNGYDEKGNKINENGGDTTDYLYDNEGNIIKSTAVQLRPAGQWNFVNDEWEGFSWRSTPEFKMATGAVNEDNTIASLFIGGKAVGEGYNLLANGFQTTFKSRFFRKYLFSSATTNKGGSVKTFFNFIKYVGNRSSTHGTKFGYTKSIKIRWSGKDHHLFDW